MKRLLILCFLCWPSSIFAEVDASVVHKIVAAELLALRMPARSPFCLSILPATDYSTTGGDPSPPLLAFLSRKGMHPKRASTCIKAVKGDVISIEVTPEADGRLSAKVTFGVFTGEDLGVLRRSGVYQFTRGSTGEWVIQSYTTQISEEPAKLRVAPP